MHLLIENNFQKNSCPPKTIDADQGIPKKLYALNRFSFLQTNARPII